jgi:phosphatidylethanolamine/phosphatidyl-N-methylethanolamine N-methyltransferase
MSIHDDIQKKTDSTAVAFFQEFLRSPMQTAAVTPSSRFLAAGMVAPIPEKGDPVVVELGAGTGAFTEVIQQRLGGRGRHIALEFNSRLSGGLRDRYSDVEVVCAGARELPRVLREQGLLADVVISGLPWAAYAQSDGRPLTELIADSMSPYGAFTQFAYVWTRWAPPARRLLKDLRTTFGETLISRTVWRNVPPALVYVSRRPR